MVEIKQKPFNIKILKRKFTFSIAKKFSAKRFFGYTDISKLSHGQKMVYEIKESLQELGLFSKHKEEKKPLTEEKKKKEPEQNKALINTQKFAVKFFGVFILLFGLFVAHVGMLLTNINVTYVDEFSTPFIEVEEKEHALVPYGVETAPMNVLYSLVSINSSKMNQTNYTLVGFRESMPKQFYLLRFDSVRASSFLSDYRDYTGRLKRAFEDMGLVLNEITVDELDMISDRAFLIVPTMRMPTEFFEQGGKLFKKLMKNGVIILYIGEDFNTLLDSKGNYVSIQSVWPEQNVFSFLSRRDQRCDALNRYKSLSFKSSQYCVESREKSVVLTMPEDIQMFVSQDGGKIIFLPIGLSGGWEKIDDAVEDTVKIITNFNWLDKLFVKRGEINLEETILSSEPVSSEYTHIDYVIKIDALSKKTDSFYTKLIISSAYRKYRGEVFIRMPEKSIYTFIPSGLVSDVQPFLVVDFKEGYESNEKTSLWINFYEKNKLVYSYHLQKAFLVTQRIYGEPIRVDLPPGGYIAVVSKDKEQTRPVGETLVYIEPIKINSHSTSDDWKNGKLNFSITTKNHDDEKFYPFRKVTISLNKKQLGTFEFSQVTRYIIIQTEPFEPGVYVFNFSFNENAYSIPFEVTYVKPYNWYEDPVYLSLLGFFGILIIIARLFRRPEEKIYYIDIPDFPLHKLHTVKLNRDFCLLLFEKINRQYNWTYMPLTVEEIRKTLANIDYQGRKILTTDYNIELLMEQLREYNLIGKFKNYYAPLKWEAESKLSLKVLGTIRIVRELCLNYAFMFTVNLSRSMPHLIIKLPVKEIGVFAYDSALSNQAVINHANTEETIILFEDIEEKISFRNSLYSTNEVDQLLKILIKNKRIQLLTIEELGNYLKAFRR